MANIAARFKWVFGTAEAASSPGRGASANVLGSTGVGVAFNTHGWGEAYTFHCEADAAATCSYQIRASRTSSGPWAVLSSGTLSTFATDIVQLPGPLGWVSPRCKTLNSTANQFVVALSAVEG
jgi:hypothetical protein